jgi:glycosyltransferase involved in cell wall biosynthesis
MNKLKDKNVAIIYDRVNKWGGAERTLLALQEIFPHSTLYTAVYDEKGADWARQFKSVVPSFLQKIPFAKKRHELLSIFTPIAFESFDFSDYDLVISVTSESAKGVITKPETFHICYCLTPIRYLYSGHDEYFDNPPVYFKYFPFFKTISRLPVWYMRMWDQVAKDRPDIYIAISSEVKRRIKKYYKRDSKIIFPPTELEKFGKGVKNVKKKDYYLYVSRLVPYKKADLAIKAFNKIEKKLVVVGIGSEIDRLKTLAKDNIEFKGKVSEQELVRLYQEARGLIFPQIEDFGMVVVEAQAAGTAVIAFNEGGSLDTVKDGITGILFEKQSPSSIIKAVERFEKKKFKVNDLLENAEKFSKKKFQDDFKRLIEEKYGV